MADLSPGYLTAYFARGSGRCATDLHPNCRKFRGAPLARRSGSHRGLHDSSLLQHIPDADGLGTVEHLLDGFVVLIPRAAVCLFSASAAWRALSNHHGKDYRPRRIELGRWKYLTCAMSLMLVFFITGLPFLTMLYASLLPRFRPPTAEAFAAMSLLNYKTLLTEGGYALQPLWNSTVLGVSAATAVMLLVAAISYFVHKTRLGGR